MDSQFITQLREALQNPIIQKEIISIIKGSISVSIDDNFDGYNPSNLNDLTVEVSFTKN